MDHGWDRSSSIVQNVMYGHHFEGLFLIITQEKLRRSEGIPSHFFVPDSLYRAIPCLKDTYILSASFLLVRCSPHSALINLLFLRGFPAATLLNCPNLSWLSISWFNDRENQVDLGTYIPSIFCRTFRAICLACDWSDENAHSTWSCLDLSMGLPYQSYYACSHHTTH